MPKKIDWDKVSREKKSTKDREVPSKVAGSPEQKTFRGEAKKKIWKEPPPPKEKYPCPICKKMVNDVESHLNNTHREFRCSWCGKQFKGLFAVKAHIRQKHR
jgi:DNA-directed RNA polymerase subunit RPC12/RpoP